MLYDKRWELDDTGRMLMDAADYMKRHGWCRHRWEDADGAVCLLGALMRVIKKGGSVYYGAHERITKVLGLEDDTQIGIWNDDHCRSKDEAVAVLRAAARCQ